MKLLPATAPRAFAGRPGPPRARWLRSAALLGLLATSGWRAAPRQGAARSEPGVNPTPVRLVRPAVRPLSEMARIGRDMFFDPRLSVSGTQSCASCHSPAHAYGPPDGRAVQPGGLEGRDEGRRAVPSLRYVDLTPPFSIGPDVAGEDAPALRPVPSPALPAPSAARPRKLAGSAAATVAMVPRGGLFWDGRAGTLQSQAMGPLFDRVEMANTDTAALAGRLRAAYGARLAELVGGEAVANPRLLVYEAMFAVAQFQVEDPSFHPYSSKYDAYLEGRARLTATEARGLAAFEDSARGNCAGCHPDRPGPDGRPPLFTDFQYEALGVPRNRELRGSRAAGDYDLGLCGPTRTDLAGQAQYCGMFRTPSLRNVATRRVFFHNGRYHRLQDVLAFYALRDTRPEAVYPRGADGRVWRFDDLPAAYRGNVDVADPPFGRRAGDASPLSERDRRDIIAFLRTLTDGYREPR
jgi:cytochrome c peroxidase